MIAIFRLLLAAFLLFATPLQPELGFRNIIMVEMQSDGHTLDLRPKPNKRPALNSTCPVLVLYNDDTKMLLIDNSDNETVIEYRIYNSSTCNLSGSINENEQSDISMDGYEGPLTVEVVVGNQTFCGQIVTESNPD